MADREKVLKGLEVCGKSGLLCPAKDCPYSEYALTCKYQLMRDTLELLEGGRGWTMVWTMVTEKLPKAGEYVLCCTETKAGQKNIIRGYWADGMWRCGMNNNVIAWMPLPDLPREVPSDG